MSLPTRREQTAGDRNPQGLAELGPEPGTEREQVLTFYTTPVVYLALSVINGARTGHEGTMGHDGLTLRQGVLESSDVPGDAASARRFREIVDAHYDFIWRSLRRLGVASSDTDDAAQQVFVTAARKLARIRLGSERSFLFQTALRTAADHRRTRRRRREAIADEDLDGDQVPDDAPTAEDVVDLRRARRTLDAILDDMPMDLRAVFALFELEQVTMAEISVLLDLPAGTVASRLRRARREFRDRVAALAQSQTLRGGDT